MRKKAVIPACRQHICLPVLFCTIAHIGEDLRRDAGFEDGVDQPVETVGGSASQAEIAAAWRRVCAIAPLAAKSSSDLRNVLYQPRDRIAKFVNRRFLDFQKSFVLREVALLMRGIQYAPQRGRPIQRMHQALKHGIAALAAIAVPSQGGQRRRTRGVVSAGEAAFGREAGEMGVSQTRAHHRQHAFDFGVVAWLSFELAGPHQIVESGQGQPDFPASLMTDCANTRLTNESGSARRRSNSAGV